MGGTTKEDVIENLMAVCSPCHDKYGDEKRYKKYLYVRHREVMDLNGVKYDKGLMNDLIQRS
jgi:hypothetical protein